MKPQNPYTRLKNECHQWALSVLHPQRKTMFLISKSKLGGTYTLGDVYERAVAANTLGWDVVLVADDLGLTIQYIERPGPRPRAIQ